MNEAMLKQWVAGTLSHAEEREVARWMVRCTDPKLPQVLLGMLREQREAQADAEQSALGAVWQRLNQAWNTLLDIGDAAWVQPGMALQPASLTAGEEADALVLTDDEALAVSVAGSEPVQVAVTNGAGEVYVLHGQPDDTVVLPLDLGARPTVWIVRGAQTILTANDLTDAIASSDTRVSALRWRD